MNASIFSRCALLAACTVTAPMAQAITLYTETFAPFTNSDLASYGWWNRAYEHASTGYYNNNEWQPVSVAASSYIYGGGGGGNNDYLTYSTEYVVDRSQYTNLALSWTNSANDPTPGTNQNYRAAIRLGGQWYATTTAQQGQTAALTFDIDDNMSLLTEVPGAIGQSPSLRGFVLGAAVGSLPAGNIDAFGILMTDQKGDVRYINPTLTGDVVPEPASLAGSALAIAMLASRRRKVTG